MKVKSKLFCPFCDLKNVGNKVLIDHLENKKCEGLKNMRAKKEMLKNKFKELNDPS